MAATAKKVLLLRSAEGKVLMAPTWDTRPFAHFLPPLEIRASTRALEKVINYWTIHNRAAARGYAGSALLWKWDLEFVRRLCEEEGLAEEVHAAAMLLQRQNLADLIQLISDSRARAARCCAAGKEYYVDLDPDDDEVKKDVVAEGAAESAATAVPRPLGLLPGPGTRGSPPVVPTHP